MMSKLAGDGTLATSIRRTETIIADPLLPPQSSGTPFVSSDTFSTWFCKLPRYYNEEQEFDQLPSVSFEMINDVALYCVRTERDNVLTVHDAFLRYHIDGYLDGEFGSFDLDEKFMHTLFSAKPIRLSTILAHIQQNADEGKRAGLLVCLLDKLGRLVHTPFETSACHTWLTRLQYMLDSRDTPVRFDTPAWRHRNRTTLPLDITIDEILDELQLLVRKVEYFTSMGDVFAFLQSVKNLAEVTANLPFKDRARRQVDKEHLRRYKQLFQIIWDMYIIVPHDATTEMLDTFPTKMRAATPPLVHTRPQNHRGEQVQWGDEIGGGRANQDGTYDVDVDSSSSSSVPQLADCMCCEYIMEQQQQQQQQQGVEPTLDIGADDEEIDLFPAPQTM